MSDVTHVKGFVETLSDGGNIISSGSSSLLSSYYFVMSLACSITVGIPYFILFWIYYLIPKMNFLSNILSMSSYSHDIELEN